MTEGQHTARSSAKPEQPKTRDALVKHVDKQQALALSGLGEKNLLRLEAGNPQRILSINEFLSFWGMHPELHSGGYSLGLTNSHELYETVSKAAGLSPWMESYEEMDIWKMGNVTVDRYDQVVRNLPENHTDIFLERITATNKPIVFFVPSHVLDFSEETVKNISRDEMLWFLSHPDRMQNVFFVFGLYEMFNSSEWLEFVKENRFFEERTQVMVDMFHEQMKGDTR